MKRHLFGLLAAVPMLSVALAAPAAHAAAPNAAATSFGITHTPSIEIVGAPCSVVPNVLENDQLIRAFPERLAYPLPNDVTVSGPDGTTKTIAKGTLVDSYYFHADWRNQGQNASKKFEGSMTFAQPVLGMIKATNDLVNTHAALGAPSTTYSNAIDQAPEGYDDAVWFSNAAQTVNMNLTVWNVADQVRVLTTASPAITPSGAFEVVGAPCSVMENTFESDQHIRVFPERLNYVLPADITLDAHGALGTVIRQGTKVNVYYVHADRVGDQAGIVKQLSGKLTFNTKILAVLSSSAALNSTHSTLGARQHASITTSYSGSGVQGLDYGDTVTVYPRQNRVDVAFDVWNVVDQVRIITLAP